MNNDSERQKNYIRLHKRHHHLITIARMFLFVAFLCIWEIASNRSWIDSFFFSSPSRIGTLFLTMLTDGSLFLHTGVTLLETLISFFFLSVISILSATVLWYFCTLSEILEPYLVILNSLPKSALAPLFIVWLGTGMKTIIIAGISVAVFGSVISLYTGFCQADKEKAMVIYTLGGTKTDALTKVIFPSSIPIILSNMKINIGLALVGVIIGEFLASRRGLGYLIIYGSQVFQLNLVITSIIILCMIAMMLYQGLQWLEHQYKKSGR